MQAGPEESGIKTLRPLLTALQCGEPPGLWSGSLKLRSVGFGLHPSRLHSTQITIYYPPICTPAPATGERSRRGEGTGTRGGGGNQMKATFDLTFVLPEEEPLSRGH